VRCAPCFPNFEYYYHGLLLPALDFITPLMQRIQPRSNSSFSKQFIHTNAPVLFAIAFAA